MRTLTFVLALLAAPVAADDLDCSNAMTQQAMNQCAHASYLLADEELNRAYKLAVAQAREMDEYLQEGEVPAVTMLRDAQRAWITFRDKACEVDSLVVRGGSMQPLIYAGCLEQQTRARTESLLAFAAGMP
ncbi:MAG: lysozyme inhibitor LprI family protein [Pseudomonadota bacterium]|nr:lysozyme inhibitor LprI family protein [Pseudomonadota bacterium]